MASYNLNFHQTFYPTIEYISRLLAIADDTRILTKEEISEITGIPTGEKSGKVEPHILYGAYMNLIVPNKEGMQYRLKRTELGDMVYREDPNIIEDITLLLCHYYLTSSSYGADMWYFIIREIFKKYNNSVSEPVLYEELKQRYHKSNIKLAPFIKTYEESFNKLSAIKIEENQVGNRNLHFTPHKFHKDFLFLYAYTLLDEWEKVFGSVTEVIIGDISAKLKWGNAFAWGEVAEFSVLEKISDLGIIKINKQLSPTTVVKIADCKTIRQKIYSLLF